MKKIAFAAIIFAASTTPSFAQVMRGADGCQAPPYYTAPNCSTATPRSLESPRGAYVRSPETGEQAGEATGYGLRGFGVRLPAISLDLPEIRLPCLVKYRRNPEMHVEGSRAPWVEGRALEFNQVPRNLEETTPRAFEQPREMCIPPAPCTSETEKRLRDELARKDHELQQMQSRFDRLEGIVERLAESRSPSREVAARNAQRSAPAKLIEANYTEDSERSEPAIPTPSNTSSAIRSIKPDNTQRSGIADQRGESTVKTTTDGDNDGLGVWRQQRRRLSNFGSNGSVN